MTKNQLCTIRGLSLITLSILTIAIYTVVLMNLPDYFQDCKMMKITAKVSRFFSCIILFIGASSLKHPDEDAEDMQYVPITILGFFQFVCFIFFLRIRLFGYHHLFAFNDNFGVLVALQSTLSIIILCTFHNEKTRRLLFENRSWRKESDNHLIRWCSAAGIYFSLISIAVILVVDISFSLMFKPSYEEQGYGFVNLGLDSGTVWADGNLFSTELTDEGISMRWTSHLGDSTIALNQFVGDRMSNLIIPTESDWYELFAECKTLPSYYKGVYGMTIVGKNRVKRMFLPAPDSDLYSPTIYWTATPSAPYVDYYEQWYEVEDEDDDDDVAEDIEDGNDSSFSESEESVTEVSEECLEETIPDEMCTVNLYTIEYLPWGVVRNDVSNTYLRGYVRLIKR